MLHISTGFTIYILAVTFLLGTCLGSFSACLASRLLTGESALSGRSHCDSCGHVLAHLARPLPLLRREGSGGVLCHGASGGNWLLPDGVPL